MAPHWQSSQVKQSNDDPIVALWFATNQCETVDMANDVARLGAAITERRRQLGLSQIEVWQRGGPSNSTLTRIENGLGDPPSAATLRKLDTALDWEPGSAIHTLSGGDPVAQMDNIERLAQIAKDASAAASEPLHTVVSGAEEKLLKNVLGTTPARTRPSVAGDRPTTFGDLEDLHARIERLTPEHVARVSRYVDNLIARQENDEVNRRSVDELTQVPVFDATGEDVLVAIRTAEAFLDSEFFDAYAPAHATTDTVNNFASVAMLVQRRIRHLGDLLTDDETDRLFGNAVSPGTATESILDEAEEIQRRVRRFVGRLVAAYQSTSDSVRRHGIDLYIRVSRNPDLVPYLSETQLDALAEASGFRQQLRLDLSRMSDVPDTVAASDRGPDSKHQPNTHGEESQDPGTDDPA